MKYAAALLACFTAALLIAAPASAQQRLAGTWRVQEVAGQKTPQGVELTFAFVDETKVTLTYSLAGDAPQTWDFRFSIDQGQLKLEPAKTLGEPDSITYDIRFEDGKLLLLEPKQKDADTQVQETEPQTPQASPEGDANADAKVDGVEAQADPSVAETESDKAEPAVEGTDTQTTQESDADAAEASPEEDTRKPVWVLVQN